MNKKIIRIILTVLYFGLMIGYGYTEVNGDIRSVLNGPKVILLLAGIGIFYGLLYVITLKVVTFFEKLCIKIANKEAYEPELVKNLTFDVLIVVFLAHICSLYLIKFVQPTIAYLFFFLIPVGMAFFKISKLEVKTILKKVIMMIPILVYILADSLMIANMI